MKTFKKIMVLTMTLSLVLFSSCSKSDDEGGEGSAGSGTLTAKVDGTSYKSMKISSSATVASAGPGENLIIIASNSDGNAFAITIFGYTGTGTYEITGANLAVTNAASYTETNVNLSNPTASTTEIWQAPYDATKIGSLSVSEETGSTIKGTFNFKCKNVLGDKSIKNITDGSFNLSKKTS